VLHRFPINIQFATFSLLVVFYARVAYYEKWESTYKKRVVAAYSFVNISVLLGFAGNDFISFTSFLTTVQYGSY